MHCIAISRLWMPIKLWGEATPISLYWDPAAERIWRYNSAMRLIVILRNPIERAYSHWAMEHRRGNDPLSLRPCAGTGGSPLPRSPAPPAQGFLLRRPWLLQRSAQATLAILRQRASAGAPARGTKTSPRDCLDKYLATSQHSIRPCHYSAGTPQR